MSDIDYVHAPAFGAEPEPPTFAPDPVFRPHHYAQFTIEPATFIAANGLPFLIGNAIKYACRHDAKGGKEDIRKAIRCLEMHLETLHRADRIAAGESPAVVWSDVL